MSRQRILVLNQYYWPGVEATAHLLTELCEALAEDYEVEVVTGVLHGHEDEPRQIDWAVRYWERARGAGLPVDLELVETNFVQLRVAELGIDEHDALERVRAQGVALSQTKPGILRAVTHLDLTDEDVEQALRAVPAALGAHVHA